MVYRGSRRAREEARIPQTKYLDKTIIQFDVGSNLSQLNVLPHATIKTLN
ncbi:hypothetical protein PI124_g15212 [Phytophthora idaei]|nr:hypothetical protein PI125_g19589 [Phytophthora idaei]KAG3136763.1 hypothetical protein PI126_g17667 [Phytophthora idaei]KAG3239855.1 hypothetical protein PI124_g15212 [Phytophthora idaei]